MKRSGSTILLIVGFLIGLALLMYPTFADSWNRGMAIQSVANYSDAVATMSSDEANRMMAEAYEYNQDLIDTQTVGILSLSKEAIYNDTLNVKSDGMMGFVEIDKINITLPIYHGVSEEVLAIATGHLNWTSLPVGSPSWDSKTQSISPNEGTHIVISGHRGLPSAKLFTDLDQVAEGDLFSLTVLKTVYTYQVDQIRTVLPTDLGELHIEKGIDYCTLVTCTPYGVNSHRLLIRGHRVNPEVTYMVQSNSTQIKPALVAAVLAVGILVPLFLFAIIIPTGFRKKRAIDERILEELEVAELPLYRLDLSVMEINRLMRRDNKQETVSETQTANTEDKRTKQSREGKKRKNKQ